METEQEPETIEEKTESANDPYGEADLKTRVGVAARVAAEAGEFKAQAFEKVLDRLLGTSLAVVQGATRITPRVEQVDRNARKMAKRLPRAPASSLERIKPVMNASGETVGEWAVKIEKLPAKYKAHAVLAFARDNGIDGLTTGEIRHLLTSTFRVGMPDGTLRAKLSTAPPTEISRVPNEQGETIYKILRSGEEAFRRASAAAEQSAMKIE